jgi:hypothetical protein
MSLLASENENNILPEHQHFNIEKYNPRQRSDWIAVFVCFSSFSSLRHR